MTTLSDKRKITVQLWRPLLLRLNELTANTCLNRDAYLNFVFAHESEMLTHELMGKRNSEAARAHIKHCFAEVKDFQQVSFNLKISTVQSIVKACEEINVWRDTFINRVIYFLLCGPRQMAELWKINLSEYETAIFNEGREIRWLLLSPPLEAINELIQADPFQSIRTALNVRYPQNNDNLLGLHEQLIGVPTEKTREMRGLAGFNVYLDDSNVPGTPENITPADFLLLYQPGIKLSRNHDDKEGSQ